MLIVIGLVVVFAAVLGGYVLEHGNLLVLFQPAELLIIGGSSIGILLVSTPHANIRRIVKGLFAVLRPIPHTSDSYLQTLKMFYELFTYTRRVGIQGVENEVENPSQGVIFNRYPDFINDDASVAFVCDSFRLAMSAGVNSNELDQLMHLDMHVQRKDARKPINVLTSIADSLPGLGIVAAVLGVVVTMQSLGGDASQIGHKVAAALVGTFLGILLCYGVVGPLAFRMEGRNEARAEYLQVLRVAITTFLGGASPLVAAEFARRAIPSDVRPAFEEMDNIFRREARIPTPPGAAANA